MFVGALVIAAFGDFGVAGFFVVGVNMLCVRTFTSRTLENF